MKKLIGMTDYVLEQLKNATTETEKYAIVEWQNKCDAFDKIVNYANFLKQPLTLSMFIATDENIPIRSSEVSIEQHATELQQYFKNNIYGKE